MDITDTTTKIHPEDKGNKRHLTVRGGERLKQTRTDANLNQEQFAELLTTPYHHINKSKISVLERGNCNIKIKDLVLILSVTSQTAEYILTGKKKNGKLFNKGWYGKNPTTLEGIRANKQKVKEIRKELSIVSDSQDQITLDLDTPEEKEPELLYGYTREQLGKLSTKDLDYLEMIKIKVNRAATIEDRVLKLIDDLPKEFDEDADQKFMDALKEGARELDIASDKKDKVLAKKDKIIAAHVAYIDELEEALEKYTGVSLKATVIL